MEYYGNMPTMPQEGSKRTKNGKTETFYSDTGWIQDAAYNQTPKRRAPAPYKAPAGMESDPEVGGQAEFNASRGLPAPKPRGTNMGSGQRNAPSGKSNGQNFINNTPITPAKAPGASSPSFQEGVKQQQGDKAPVYGSLPTDYKSTELEAGKKAEAYRAGAGLPASGGGNSTYGRGETRTSPTGVEQKGTDMSGANALLASLGIDTVKYGAFESNDLPGKGDPRNNAAKTNTDAILGGETPKSYVKGQKSVTNRDALPTEETNIVNQQASLGSRERYRSEFMADRADMPADKNESLVGLRAAEASKGLLYASGKYWQEDGKGGFTEIDKATFKSIKRGDTHAQQFAADKIAETKAKGGIDKQPTLLEAKDDANQYDYGSDAGYGGADVDGSAPEAADYPEPSAVSPADTEDSGKTARLNMLEAKKAQGDFNKFYQRNK